jgi:hypothetical protein
MNISWLSRYIKRRSILTVVFACMVIGLLAISTHSMAQELAEVQELTGETGPGAGVVYDLPNLEQGQTLYVYAQGTSGNLDPIVFLSDGDADQSAIRSEFVAEVEQAVAAGRDPLEVIPEFADRNFLEWDDDSGRGLDAMFQFMIPADGAYKLAITSSPSAQTFGNFRLLLGLDSPEVLTGQAEPSGSTIAVINQDESRFNLAVEEITGTFTEEKRSTFFTLHEVEDGDTLYVTVETTSGDLAPTLTLVNYAGKPLRTGNFSGQQSDASLEYTFEDGGQNFILRLDACCNEGPKTAGDYRLLVGINAPEVLTGQATPTNQTVFEGPIEVKIGMKMEQISNVDQKAENFGAVVDFRMEWTDPALAFNPDDCQCLFQSFRIAEFDKYMADKGLTQWPAATLFNQQGRRDSQNQVVVVQSTGETSYVERFTATLQAPDFDFRQFPFDKQKFFIRLKSVFPEEFYVYSDLEGYSGLGEQLGEEEWIITDFGTSVDTHDGSSRFSFGFEAERHLTFYIFRIFVPVLAIIIVSWFTFFLKDYGKRVDVASANLLLFIAFNFTISGDLPRLGYLTLMDTILISTFVVTALVIVFNVYLKRMETSGRESFALRIDKYMIWIYPLAYVAAFVFVTFFFT